MVTPIEETLEQNLKVKSVRIWPHVDAIATVWIMVFIVGSQFHKTLKWKVRTGMVNVSDGKSNHEPARLKLTMELLILQRLDTSTPSTSIGPLAKSKVNKQSKQTHFFRVYTMHLWIKSNIISQF